MVIGRDSYLISWRSRKQWKCILLYMWDIMAVSRLITLAEMKALAWFHGYRPTPVAEFSRTSIERKRETKNKSWNEWNCSKHGSFHYNLWLLYINSKSMNTMWTKHDFSCWEWKLCLHSLSLFKGHRCRLDERSRPSCLTWITHIYTISSAWKEPRQMRQRERVA